MPPKKGKSKDAKSKGKAGPAKMSKKDKKLFKKYGSIQATGPDGKETFIMGMRRDELEWATERLREQVIVNRDERIRFQLERDFLYDIMQTYWKKYKCLKIEEEKEIQKTNRLNQDADENKIIKSIEGKHFRYDSQMLCTAMDVRDELRSKKIKDMLENAWQAIGMEMEDLAAQQAKMSKEYRKGVQETKLENDLNKNHQNTQFNETISSFAKKYLILLNSISEKLDDLQSYEDEYADQLRKFNLDLIQQMENSKKLFHLIRRMEYQMTEERWSEFIWKLSRNFELQYEEMKNYFNDATHSNITLIFTLQDWMNDSLERMKMYQKKIFDYERLMTDAHAKMPTLRSEYLEAKVKHDFIVRTNRGINTTNKEISLINRNINAYKTDHRNLYHQLTLLNQERNNFKNNCDLLMGEVVEKTKYRFEIKKQEAETVTEVEKLLDNQNRIRQFLPSDEAFRATVAPYKTFMDQKDVKLEQQKFKVMRIQKQSEDLRSSLEARLARIGLKKKHQTHTPEDDNVIGRVARLNWGPANLVAKKSYPKPLPLMAHIHCRTVEEDPEIKLCLTDSIRGFMAWKKKSRSIAAAAAAANK